MDANKIITKKKKISFLRLLIRNIFKSIINYLPLIYVVLGAFSFGYCFVIGSLMPFITYLISLFFVIKIQQTYNEYIELKEREKCSNGR